MGFGFDSDVSCIDFDFDLDLRASLGFTSLAQIFLYFKKNSCLLIHSLVSVAHFVFRFSPQFDVTY